MSRAALPEPTHDQVLGGRFQVLRPLAEGGMARVYVGRDTATGDEVAVKVLGPSADPRSVARERMEREGAALQRLDHPNIVRTLAHGPTDEGGYFIAMELVRGPSLTSWLRDQEASPPTVIQLLLQVCSALRHAHRKGIVHRDLKGSNLLVAQDERGNARVKLIDFGVVQVEGEDSLSGTRDILGSVHTIAPEQVKGEIVDHRADIYSLGVIAFRMLSGRYPYHSKVSAEVMSRHVHAPVPILEASLGLPAGLPEIVAKCMAKDPDDRYADVQQLMDELSVCLDVPTSFFVRPVLAREPAPRDDEPVPVAVFVVVGALLVAAALISWVLL